MKRGMVTMRHAPVAITALTLAALSGVAWPFAVDDAFIPVRYATRLAAGLGYTFSGVDASDGVTGPLWLLPLVASARLGLPLLPLAKGVSCAASLVAACWLVARAGHLARGREASIWVATICASSLPYVAWSVAGLETGVATLLVSWLLASVLARRALQAGSAVALMAWLRPELALFAGVLLAWRRGGLTIALAGVAALLAFRWTMFAHLLPMTANAKPALLSNGLAYLGAALAQPRGALAALLFVLACVRGGRVTRIVAAAVVAHALAVVLAGGDWMPARRLFVPILPVFAWVLARGLRGWRYAPAALASLLALGARELIVELPALREAGARRERMVPRLARAACPHGPIALVDVGALGVACPARDVVDLAGLTTPSVAYAPGGHLAKRIDEAWLRAQEPRALVLHSRERPRVDAAGRLRWFAGYPVERRVLGFTFVREFRVHEVLEYAPSYFYVVLIAPR